MIRRGPATLICTLLTLQLLVSPALVAQTKWTNRSAPAKQPRAAAGELPLSLSDSDGQGLAFESLDVRVAISGMLSLTEIDVVFRNPQERRIEGRFDATLPADASVSRFAKEIDGRLMEGEVVERLRANQVYEQFLHRTRDPALLEQDQGNRFSARIFPIEPKASVRILLSYTQLLEVREGRRAWSFPLRGLRNIGAFSFRGTVAPLPGESTGRGSRDVRGVSGSVTTTDVAEQTEKDYNPDHDLELSWQAAADQPLTLIRSGDYFLASLRLPEKVAGREPSLPIVAYLDTSASASISAEHRIEAIRRFFAALPREQRVEVVAFDLSIVPLVSGTAGDVAAKLPSLLAARHFLGGTDLGLIVDDIARRQGAAAPMRYLIVSDGIATLGDLADDAILARLQNRGGSRLDALVVGSRQAPILRRLTTGRGRVVEIPLTESFRDAASAAATDFLEPLGATVSVADPNAEWIFPGSITDLRPGREVFILGKLRTGRSESGLRVTGGEGPLSARDALELPGRGFDLLLEREAWRTYLDYLGDRAATERDAAIRDAIERQRVALSVEHRVVIPTTTMLVLETEADYARFGIDRSAPSTILHIGSTGVEKLTRVHVDLPPPPPTWENAPIGTLAGVVRTEGAPLPGVTITISSPGLQGTRVAVSNVNGDFNFPALPPADYTVKFEMESMATVTKTVRVGLARTERVDAAMQLSAVAEAITVTAVAPSVLETTELQSNYAGEFVEDLPVARTTTGGGERASAPPPPPPPAQVAAPSIPPPPPPPPAPVPQPVTSQSQPAPAPIEAPADTAGAAEVPTVAREAESPARTDASARPVPLPPPPIPSVQPEAPKPDSSWIRGWPKDDDARQLEKAILADPMERRNYTLLSDRYSTSKDWPRLADLALRWQPYDPENPQVYEALGEAALAAGRRNEAIRAYASIAEIAPSRPELLQRAGLLLMKAGGGAIAEAPLRRALELRPDRVNAYRHLALFLWKEKRFEEAAAVLELARLREFPDWYGGVQQVIAEELGYIYRAWAAAEPKREAKIRERAREYSADMDRRDALRITLAWETDASDVDLHVVDPRGAECFYSNLKTGSGLQLYGDVTQGLGPEVVQTSSMVKGVYSIGVNYFDPGPMGVSRGIVTVIRTDKNRSDPDVEVLPFRLVEATHGEAVQLLAKVKF